MASLAAIATTPLAAIKGLARSSLTGKKAPPEAHHPELETQIIKFPVHSPREDYKLLILGGGSTLAYSSAKAAGDILLIKRGPQLPQKLGPRCKI